MSHGNTTALLPAFKALRLPQNKRDARKEETALSSSLWHLIFHQAERQRAESGCVSAVWKNLWAGQVGERFHLLGITHCDTFMCTKINHKSGVQSKWYWYTVFGGLKIEIKQPGLVNFTKNCLFFFSPLHNLSLYQPIISDRNTKPCENKHYSH